MSDIRDQLRKAGLVSDKQVRRAKHEERLHASQVGADGIAAERRERDLRLQAEREAQRIAARERERRGQEAKQAEETGGRLAQTIRRGWLREAAGGNRRFFFEARAGRITYLDLSEVAVGRLAAGSAAIIETGGAVRGEFCVVDGKAAEEIRRIAPERILVFHRGGGARSPDR